MLPYIELFGTKTPSYGLMLMLGFCAAYALALYRRKVNGMSALDITVAILFAGMGAFIGSKLFFMAQGVIQGIPSDMARAIESGGSGLFFWEYFKRAGLVYYGGFIGCMLFLPIFSAIYKISIWKVVDSLLPSLPLAQGIGRIGCFMAGCCYGMPFEHGVYMSASGLAPHDIKLLPVQLIEAACVFILCAAMTVYGKVPRKPGRILSIYLIGYGTIRFVLEFFRYDAVRGFIYTLSVSQWVSLALIGAGIFFAFFYRRGKEGRPANA